MDKKTVANSNCSEFIRKGDRFHDVGLKGQLAVPGPTAYNMPSKISESTGKTIGTRHKSVSNDALLGPGPGAYTADKQKQKNFAYS